METIFIVNGETQLALVPKTELERQLLTKLTESGPIELDIVRQPIGILGRSVKDALIIRPKSLKNAEDQAEDL